MDYDTFVSKFPSQKILDLFLPKAEFFTLFKKNFDKEGPIAVGMSDVEIARLWESGEITLGRRDKFVLNVEKFDIEPYYQRRLVAEVREVLLGPIVETVRALQETHSTALPPILIGDDGVLSWQDGRRSLAEDATDEERALIKAIVLDMRQVVENESFEWGEIGTLAVVEGALIFTPLPRKPDAVSYRKRARVLGNFTPLDED